MYVCVCMYVHPQQMFLAYKSQTDDWIFTILTYKIDIVLESEDDPRSRSQDQRSRSNMQLYQKNCIDYKS